jgi:hypothetical protein
VPLKKFSRQAEQFRSVRPWRWGQLLERRNRQPLTIGLGLCVLAAFSGSNTVIYYAASVFKVLPSDYRPRLVSSNPGSRIRPASGKRYLKTLLT